MEWSGEIGDDDGEILQGGSGRGYFDGRVDEGVVIFGADLAEVAVDGGGEVAVGRGNDGEIRGKKSGLGIWPIDGSGFRPDIDGGLKR